MSVKLRMEIGNVSKMQHERRAENSPRQLLNVSSTQREYPVPESGFNNPNNSVVIFR